MTIHELCDDILKLCSTRYQLESDLKEKYKPIASLIEIENALNSLTSNQPAYLYKNGYTYNLTSAGKIFWDSGGYAGQVQRDAEEKRARQEEQKLRKDVEKSVLDTNTSVRKTHILQIITMIVTAIVAICAFLLSLFSYLRNDERLPILLLQQQQSQMQREIDSLQSLTKLPASQDTLQTKLP